MKRRAGVTLIVILTFLNIVAAQQPNQSTTKLVRPLILHILLKARVSGSLEYSGSCHVERPQPDISNVHVLLKHWGRSPVQELAEMFADDRKMRVTQDSDGTIRMVERGVPMDFLDIRVSHISFDKVYDADAALKSILGTPEVHSFMKRHNIAARDTTLAISTSASYSSIDTVHMLVDVDNITVFQALDYVLKAFPGLWIYEDCTTDKGVRRVFLGFYKK